MGIRQTQRLGQSLGQRAAEERLHFDAHLARAGLTCPVCVDRWDYTHALQMSPAADCSPVRHLYICTHLDTRHNNLYDRRRAIYILFTY